MGKTDWCEAKHEKVQRERTEKTEGWLVLTADNYPVEVSFKIVFVILGETRILVLLPRTT